MKFRIDHWSMKKSQLHIRLGQNTVTVVDDDVVHLCRKCVRFHTLVSRSNVLPWPKTLTIHLRTKSWPTLSEREREREFNTTTRTTTTTRTVAWFWFGLFVCLFLTWWDDDDVVVVELKCNAIQWRKQQNRVCVSLFLCIHLVVSSSLRCITYYIPKN